MTAHAIGGAVLALGIGIGLVGGRARDAEAGREAAAIPDEPPAVLAAACRTGFKGV